MTPRLDDDPPRRLPAHIAEDAVMPSIDRSERSGSMWLVLLLAVILVGGVVAATVLEDDQRSAFVLWFLGRRGQRRQQQQQGRSMQSDGEAEAGDARPAHAAIAVVILLDVGEIFRHAHGSGVEGPGRFGRGGLRCDLMAAGIP